jgi:2-oxoisovalerate dehydrogenase E1 component
MRRLAASGQRPALAAWAPTQVALRARAVEQLLLTLFRANRLHGTVHTALGQEYCAAALHPHLDATVDGFVGSHRAHAHYLAAGGPEDALLAELMGREGALCGGRGGSQYLHHRQFFSAGVQGGGSLWGTGLAWAHRIDRTGGLVVVQLGDGTLGEGAVYEAFTFAALHHVPVLFYLEWNGWAQSTPTSLTTPGEVVTRARGFGIEAHRHADTDPIALHAHLGEVVARARTGVPTLQVVDTRRLAAHSAGDDRRAPAELARLRLQDPLTQLLETDTGTRAAFGAMASELQALAETVAARPLVARRPVSPTTVHRAPHDTPGPADATIRDRLNQGLAACLDEDERVLVLGQDLVDPYGGAFTVTRGLSTRFPDRVVPTPIAEAGVVGVAAGLALAGFRPVVELMFADFATLACDQLVNQAAKFRGVYGDDIRCPLVVRVVSGGGRGYGPTHSQSLEQLFVGVPGLRVVCLSSRHDAGRLLRQVVRTAAEPVVFVEYKATYGLVPPPTPPLDLVCEPSVRGDDPLAPLCFTSPHASLTIVCCGGCVREVDEAMVTLFVEHEQGCDLIVLTEVWPLDVADVLPSVQRTGRLVVVEDGVPDYGVSAAVVAAVAQVVPVRARTVGARPVCVPAARHLERDTLVSAERVVAAALELT